MNRSTNEFENSTLGFISYNYDSHVFCIIGSLK